MKYQRDSCILESRGRYLLHRETILKKCVMLKEWRRIENRKMEQINGIFVIENKSRHTTKNNDYKEKYNGRVT